MFPELSGDIPATDDSQMEQTSRGDQTYSTGGRKASGTVLNGVGQVRHHGRMLTHPRGLVVDRSRMHLVSVKRKTNSAIRTYNTYHVL